MNSLPCALVSFVCCASYNGCTAPCMTTLTFTGNPNDTYSSPFIDFGMGPGYEFMIHRRAEHLFLDAPQPNLHHLRRHGRLRHTNLAVGALERC